MPSPYYSLRNALSAQATTFNEGNSPAMTVAPRRHLYLTALAILFIVMLLLVFISVSTYRNLNRERNAAMQTVRRQALTLINALAAGARAGMMMQMAGKDAIGNLVHEIGRSGDVNYLYLVNAAGEVVHHSIPSLEGTRAVWRPDFERAGDVRTRIRRLADGVHVYEVAKPFAPVGIHLAATLPSSGDSSAASPTHFHSRATVYLGMTMAAYDAARQSDLQHAMIMGGIVLALGGGVIYFFIVIRSYYLLEEQVRRAEKLAVVGRLAAGVAHEIRNPLSSIRGFAYLLGRGHGKETPEREYADVMVREIDRINRVVTDLLNFSRPMTLEPEITRLPDLVDHVVSLVSADAKKHGVAIHIDCESGLPLMMLDPNQITQALLNLMLNAINAMERGGAAEIRASALNEGAGVKILVTDNGPGIDRDVQEKIFEPFYTTRERGTGLGLAMVRKIAENHDGGVAVESPPPGKSSGTRFTLSLRNMKANP
jgi:two-component system sensor histidine kinase HydH